MSYRTLFTVLEETAAKYGPRPALLQPEGKAGGGAKENPRVRTYSWAEYRDAAREVACGLRALGIVRGDIVALHSETRAEFYIADLGVMANGSIAAALYTSLPPADHVTTIRKSEPKVLMVESPRGMRLLREAGVGDGVDGLLWILMTGEAPAVDPCTLTLDQVRAKGREAAAADPSFFPRLHGEVRPEDYAILYMTSGATGEPKMGLVTHAALVANIEMGPKVLQLGPDDRTLVFLPSAHIAQRVVLELLPMMYGTPVYFSEGLAKMPTEMRELKPTFLLAPPRVWERIYASVSTEVRKKPAVAQKLFFGALGLGLRAAKYRHEGKPVPAWISSALKVADKLVFSKVRERLGGELKVAASGAAPLGRDLAQFFEAIGLPLVEGYGLTEGGVATLNPVGNPRAGSIGKALPGVQLSLGEDNELLIRSPGLFSGYFKDPEATAAVLRDGCLYTGDIAEIDANGFVYITGRKKELIVSSNGKKIYPSRIESLFKVEPLVSQILLIGDRQPYVTALVTINVAAAEALEGMQNLKGSDPAKLVKAEPVVREVDQVVKRVNRQLAPFEQIRRVRILERDFSIERGEMTPTMKVRRKQVLDNYRTLVQELYLGKEEF